MNIQLFLVFVVLNVLNVIIQTVKSICTVKCGRVVASLVNALAYGFYTVVLIYMVCELPLFLKVIVVSSANLIGVFIVKTLEEKATKDKLWKVELTVSNIEKAGLKTELTCLNIPFNYIEIGTYTIFNIFCQTQKESAFVRELTDRHNAKYFASESKRL